MIKIAPSILSADFARLADGLALIEAGGADLVHIDVMDGHFVPNLTIGAPVVSAISKVTDLPLDCHLMITHPERYIPAFIEAGASSITVHQEACTHLHRVLGMIREAGLKTGVALNPATSIDTIDEVLGHLDIVLVMSVNPGFSGQAFIPESTDKVQRLAQRARERKLGFEIQVDGGVSAATIGELSAAGARSFVAGSAVFGTSDPQSAIAELKNVGEAST